ncbi:DUF559 domain-containing protein [Sphingomonas sp. HF-S4]|uniref:DUF559 domain-containing protein n=1 Tax=Sphingomonas agrestis TaxID=3080540 RepID=A0ABU3Y2H9_9SPHN|nr:DUF559 domain-containing protein [Sphingomonas sp. HF-S4]MDV3455564.1 DUF559 domain-containing protein [Sphingomonas sp. HF-S4]
MRRPETDTARKLRREMTLPEVLLWQRLRGAKVGVKFRRQHPIGPCVADFYCASARLVVEIDGEIHADRVDDDQARDQFMQETDMRLCA